MSKMLGIIFAFALTIFCTACTGSFQASHPHHQKLLMNFNDPELSVIRDDLSADKAASMGVVEANSGSSLPARYGSINAASSGAAPDDIAGILNEATGARKEKLGLSREDSQALGCDIGDRFDRKALLAYNFSDQQSRLALHMNVEGPSFSDPGHFQLNSFAIRFTHKFQKPAQRQKNLCLFPSGFQGLLGSSYHEFFIRNNYTVVDQLKDMGLDLK